MAPPRKSVTVKSAIKPVTGPSRVTKTQARKTIKRATGSHRLRTIPPPSITSLESSPSRESVVSNTQTLHSIHSKDNHAESRALNRLSTILEEGFRNMGLEIRRANASTFDQLTERIEGALEKLSRNTRTAESDSPGTSHTPLLSLPPATTTDVLRRYNWVEKSVIESIANEAFDINNLPKLHRSEEFRNQHVKATAKGIYQPFDKNEKPEVYMTNTRLHLTFDEPSKFFSAWEIYVAIRTAFAPDRAQGFALFAERIWYWILLPHPWAAILNYILEFFRNHQSAPIETWYVPDTVLVVDNIGVGSHRSTGKRIGSPKGGSNKSGTGYKKPGDDKSTQVCYNWNTLDYGCRRKNCERQHVCSTCNQAGHRKFQCPPK